MTRQEEIKEGIIVVLKASWEVDEFTIHDGYDLDEKKATDKILSYLHSQGVVIKVDGKPCNKELYCGNVALTFLAGSPVFYCTLRRREFPKKCRDCPEYKPTELVAVEPLVDV